MVADKVIPNMRNVVRGKRIIKPTITVRRRQRMSAPAEHDQREWKNADGLDPKEAERKTEGSKHQ